MLPLSRIKLPVLLSPLRCQAVILVIHNYYYAHGTAGLLCVAACNPGLLVPCPLDYKDTSTALFGSGRPIVPPLEISRFIAY